MHYAVPRMLQAAGRLEHLNTDICGTSGVPTFLNRIPKQFQPSALRRLIGRVPEGIPAAQIRTCPRLGWEYAVKRATARTPSDHSGVALWAARKFSQFAIQQGFAGASGIYGISGECLEQLEAGRRAGLWTAVEQIIAPRRIVDRLLAEEEECFPDWQSVAAADRFAEEFARRECQEWVQADVVVCGSEFVRTNVIEQGGDPRRCVVVPYGVDSRFSIHRDRRDPGPLRVLTIGDVGLRKGSPYVFEAARRLSGLAEFRMVGKADISEKARAMLAATLSLIPKVPRADIHHHYAWADVFLLPSICEGSATVVYEALAAGLPVITTPNTGSVVRDGIDGFVVPIRDPDAITEKLGHLAGNTALRQAMSANANARSRAFTLACYAERLFRALPQSTDGGRPGANIFSPGTS